MRQRLFVMPRGLFAGFLLLVLSPVSLSCKHVPVSGGDRSSMSQSVVAEPSWVVLPDLDVRRFPNVNPHGEIDFQSYLRLPVFHSPERAGAVNEQSVPPAGFSLNGSQLRHGPLVGGQEGCDSLALAINKATYLMNAGGKCQAWFDAHGPVKGPFYVYVHKVKLACLTEAPCWTYPFIKNIGVCQWACEKNSPELTSLLLHEVAHHYCGVAIGREKCAIEAQDVCGADWR
jgi:hypothetical protein